MDLGLKILLNKKEKIKHILKIVLIVVLVLFISGIAGILGMFVVYGRELPPLDELVISPPRASQVYDIHNELIASIYFEENRIPKRLDEISDNIIKAVISSEDERFFEHGPIDLVGILRALVTNLKTGKLREGGSTISQQLARVAFLNYDKTFSRKIKEIIIAYQLEKKYTKDEILENYLNLVNFGSGFYGVETASLGYFGKHAKDLNIGEASLLAACLSAPSAVNPYKDFERTKEKQKQVLIKMVRNGYISEDEMENALDYKITLKNAIRGNQGSMGYFIDYVKEIIEEKYGKEVLSRGGLKIYTTINKNLQEAAEKAIKKVFDKAYKDKVFEEKYKDELGVLQPQAALISVEPKTGYIVAMVGGTNYEMTNFNRTVTMRQPGSTFKLFDYTSAVDNGVVTPATILTSEPIDINGWKPVEWLQDKSFFGTLSVRNAIKVSSNIIAIKTALMTGLDRVVYYARKMGITTPLEPYPSLAIGGFEVKPIEMAEAYSIIANGGVRITPYPIRKIETDTGEILENHEYVKTRVLSEGTSYVMASLLRTVYENTTNAKISGLIAAGKTGSTNDWRDAWFDGFTPNLTAIVYVGSDTKKVDLSFIRNAGSRFPAMIWKEFMLEAIKHYPKEDFKAPTDNSVITLQVCKDSGLLASPNCPSSSVYSEVFLAQYAPLEVCNIHSPQYVTVWVCKDNQLLLAPPNCPDEKKILKTFIKGQEPKDYCECETKPPEILDAVVFEFSNLNPKIGELVSVNLTILDILLKLNTVTIEAYINDNLQAILSNEPYQFSFTASAPGEIAIKLIFKDKEGKVIYEVTKVIIVRTENDRIFP